MGVVNATTLSFGGRDGQHINMFGTGIGMGMQRNSMYFRAGTTNVMRWFFGGVHQDPEGNPGDGGTEAMSLSAGTLNLKTDLTMAGKNLNSQNVITNTVYTLDMLASRNLVGLEVHVGPLDDSRIRITNEDFQVFVNDGGDGFFRIVDRLVVSSRIEAEGFDSRSDRRLKKDIVEISDASEKLSALNGVEYLWRQDIPGHENQSPQRQSGVIAQEVKKVFPHLVSRSSDGYYAVNYNGLIPVLIEAHKEQQSEIDRLTAELAASKKISIVWEERLSALEAKVGGNSAPLASKSQAAAR